MTVATAGEVTYRSAVPAHRARFARLVALIVDTLFVGVLTSVATAVYGVTEIVSSAGAFWTSQTAIPGIWAVVIWLVYYTACEAMFSATPGKALNGLRVVAVDGRPLRVSNILFRNLLRPIDVLPGMYIVGGLFVTLTRNSQRIGDLVGGTTVVFRRDVVEPESARSSGRPAGLAFMGALLALVLFTAGFDYFQRPVLVIQSAYNQRQFANPDVTTYSLGSPTRTFDTVTYPLQAQTPTAKCTGYVTLRWYGLPGWQMASLQLSCPPS